LFWAAGGTARPLEATVQMKQMAAKVEQTKFIHPNTAHAITRYIDQRGYDCDKVACSAQLQARNRAVRTRLETLITKKTTLADFAGTREQDLLVNDAGVVTAGSIMGTEPK
jgi:hypothetical protein